jgi:short subunit dehydrogenase-like uncharacterized protein
MKVLVYGASGRLGQMVARLLRAQGYSLKLGGRSEEKLKAVSQLGDEITTAALPQQVRGVSVVANCASMTSQESDELIAAALTAGAHYADLTGEQAALRHIFETHHQEAQKAGVSLVPALGLDYAVGDLLAHLAADGRTCDQIVIAYAFEGEEAADNSVNHATSAPRGREVVFREGRWSKVPFELDLGWFRYPQPLGRQQVGRYGSGEVITVPRHIETGTIRTLITASSLVPHPALLPFFPLLRPLVALALRTPLRHLIRQVGRLIARLRPRAASSPGPRVVSDKGPSFLVVLEAEGRGFEKVRLVAGGRDCHQATARILAHGVSLLARGENRGSGVLSPAQAFQPDTFLDQLGDSVSWWKE